MHPEHLPDPHKPEPMTLRNRLIRNIFLPLSDLLRSRNLSKALKEIEAAQWWDRTALHHLQARRLSDLVAYAYAHSPYYREVMQSRGLEPGNIQGLEDLAKLPILTREGLQNNFPAGLCTSPTFQKDWVLHHTGGSTGEPVTLALNTRTIDYGRAVYYRGLSWAGCPPGTPCLTLWGQALTTSKRRAFEDRYLSFFLFGQRWIDAYKMDEASMKKGAAILRKGRVKYIHAYVSSLQEFCNYLLERNISPKGLRAVMTTAEVLHPEVREFFQNTLHCPVFNAYACGEINGVAYECDRHDGLHVGMGRVIVEIVDDEGRPVPPGRPGHIALTDLHNYATPLLRYVNGDEGILDTRRCACGRESDRIQEVLGRTCDIIDGLNGRKVFSYFFASLFFSLNWSERYQLRRFQIIQENEEQLTLNLIVGQRPSQEEEKRLTARIVDYLGPMKITIAYLDQLIVSPSGKFRWTLNRLRDKEGGSEAALLSGAPPTEGTRQDRIAEKQEPGGPPRAARDGRERPGEKDRGAGPALPPYIGGALIKAMTYSTIRMVSTACGLPLGRAWSLLRRAETWSRSERDAYRDAAFRRLMEHCWRNVPYYHDVMKERGLTPDSFRTVRDLARLPFLTKEDVRREGRRLRSKLHPDGDCLLRRSGGTTAEPIEIAVDRYSRAVETAVHLRGLEWMGYRIGNPMVRLFGGSLGLPATPTLRNRFQTWVLNVRTLPAFDLNSENVEVYAEVIRRSAGGALVGYGSAIAALAHHMDRRGLSAPGLAVVISTADQMQDEWRELIQTTLAAPIMEYYGCGELNSVAYQRRSASGFLIAEENVVVEAALGDPSRFCGEEMEEGDCCLTSLTNYAMPLIRYLNGDRLTLGGADDGFPHRRILRLAGRTMDYLTAADGHPVSGAICPHMVLKTGAPVWKWQIVQTSLTHLEFHYLPREGVEFDTATREQIVQVMQRHLGSDLRVNFIEGGFVVPPSKKHLLVVNRTGK